MSEKHFRFRSARVEHRKSKNPKDWNKLEKLCVVSFEFDRDCLDAAHLGLICPKLDAAFLELLLENGYQVPIEPAAPTARTEFDGPDFEEQGLFDEVGGV